MVLGNFCRTISPLLQVIGEVLVVFKISLPLILIVLAVIDIARAIISSKSEDVKTHIKSFLKKLAVCIAVYFIPLVMSMLFHLIGGYDEAITQSGIDYETCYSCMFSPYSSDCQESVELAEAIEN